MKLYDIPPDSKILLPINDGNAISDQICDFKHIDGMYSLIYTPNGTAVHVGASTEVELVNGVYRIV